MYFSNNLIVASLFVIASSFVNAAPTNTSSHPLTTVNSQNDFCLFLPPQPGLVVAVNENNGIPFCVNKNAVPKATAFPSGFITTAHYLKSSTYVQVTGFFDRTKYKLGANDGGGQYDNHAHGKPVGAECKGYKYFVNLIEPDIERFCIRCCQDVADCNTGRSGYGCLRVVAGDYTRDNNFGSSTNSTKKATSHQNLNLDSVLTDLDALPSSDATADDATADDATTTDDSTTDDSTSTDDSSDDSAATTTADDTTTTNANQEIATEIELLKTALSTNQTPVDQVQTKWNAFATKLASDYPQVADQINQLSTITTSLTTNEQWTAFINLVSEKIIQLQGSATDDATTADDATATTTADDATATTHTDSPEDLEWLFAHRNSHDNQATW